MSHMVIFRNADGKTGYHQAEAIADAVRFVERLRNHDGVENVRIFKMEEVSFEYRPYFRVEVSAAADAPASEPAEAEPKADDEPKAEAAATEDAVEEEAGAADPLATVPTPVPVAVGEGAASNGKRGIFSR